jgi:hypothetical protein
LIVGGIFDLGIRALSRGCLIDLTATLHNPSVFIDVGWFVVAAESRDLLTTIRAQNGS